MGLLPKQWRLYDRCMSGLLKVKFRNDLKRVKDEIRFMTLTSSPQFKDVDKKNMMRLIQSNFKLLKVRLQRYYGYDIGEYFSVRTQEGFGVIHVIYNGDYIPHSDLVDEWNEIHGSHIVDIRKVSLDDVEKQTMYLVSQYLAGSQGRNVIYGYSRHWVYGGFTKDLLMLKNACRNLDYQYINEYNITCVPVDYKKYRKYWNNWLNFNEVYDGQFSFQEYLMMKIEDGEDLVYDN